MNEPLTTNSHSFHFRQTLSDGSTVTRYLGALGVLVQEGPRPMSGVMDKTSATIKSSNLVVEGGAFLTTELAVRVLIPTRDYREAATVRARMIQWLYVRGESRLWFDDWEPETFLRVSLFSATELESVGGVGFETTLTFFMAPFRFSHEEYSITTDPVGDDDETILLDGSTPIRGMQIAHPTWTFENTSGSAITAELTVFNSTTNESFTWTGTWPDNEFLRIDSTGRKTIELAATEAALGDIGTDEFSGVTPGSVFPTLQGEKINSITLINFGGTTLVARYHAEF